MLGTSLSNYHACQPVCCAHIHIRLKLPVCRRWEALWSSYWAIKCQALPRLSIVIFSSGTTITENYAAAFEFCTLYILIDIYSQDFVSVTPETWGSSATGTVSTHKGSLPHHNVVAKYPRYVSIIKKNIYLIWNFRHSVAAWLAGLVGPEKPTKHRRQSYIKWNLTIAMQATQSFACQVHQASTNWLSFISSRSLCIEEIDSLFHV
jgi:hypothetical protein